MGDSGLGEIWSIGGAIDRIVMAVHAKVVRLVEERHAQLEQDSPRGHVLGMYDADNARDADRLKAIS